MGCIKIESYPETDPSKVKFGNNQFAFINAAAEPATVYVNDNDIAQFELITLVTSRPGTSENKLDHVDGVRVLTHTGNIYVAFNDHSLSFVEAFELANGSNVLVNLDHKPSDYLGRFKTSVNQQA